MAITPGIWEFWDNADNRQSIIDAKPILSNYASSVSFIRTPGPAPGLRLPPIVDVNDADLTRPPYQSVGKFFCTGDKNEYKKGVGYSTAFYIGNGEIMTVAHIFDEKKFCPDEACFIPAMKSEDDMYGTHYGQYLVTGNPSMHSLYKPKPADANQLDSYFDICILKLGMGRKYVGNYVNGKPRFETITIAGTQIDEVSQHTVKLEPIQVLPLPDDETCKLWKINILGYGVRPEGPEGQARPHNGKMRNCTGKFFKIEEENGKRALSIVPRSWFGMSGGPMLHEGEAYGIQSEVAYSAEGGKTCSPYFTEDLLRLGR